MSLIERGTRFAGKAAKKSAEQATRVLPFPIEITVQNRDAEQFSFSNKGHLKLSPHVQNALGHTALLLIPDTIHALHEIGTGHTLKGEKLSPNQYALAGARIAVPEIGKVITVVEGAQKATEIFQRVRNRQQPPETKHN